MKMMQFGFSTVFMFHSVIQSQVHVDVLVSIQFTVSLDVYVFTLSHFTH
jgi:hypothetical protein